MSYVIWEPKFITKIEIKDMSMFVCAADIAHSWYQTGKPQFPQ